MPTNGTLPSPDQEPSGGEVETAREPIAAWKGYTEIAGDPERLLETPASEFRSLLDAFLANPDRHRQHVDLILESYSVTMLSAIFAIPGFRGLIARGLKKNNHETLSKLNRLRDELATSVQPADVDIDVLPTSGALSDGDDSAAARLLHVKIAVWPQHNLTAASLTLRMTLQARDVRFVDHLPKSESKEIGTHEVQMSREGTFTSSVGTSGEVGASLGAKGVKLTAKSSTASTEESSTRLGAAEKFTYEGRVRKVISSAVGTTAHWMMMSAGEESPIGGLDFFVTFQVDGDERVAPLHLVVVINFADWGEFRVEKEVQVRLTSHSKQEPNA